MKWIALALLGLAIAGGVALAASRLASQQIGIASESIKAGKALAPTGLVNKGGGEKSGRGSRPRPEDREGPTETTP
ncbi:MAG TPA: hypothetical protein VG518_06175, partial [Solirubrobacterales bacterium]|nr:hypothetical protein [Solirubrobacterales bacterium]